MTKIINQSFIKLGDAKDDICFRPNQNNFLRSVNKTFCNAPSFQKHKWLQQNGEKYVQCIYDKSIRTSWPDGIHLTFYRPDKHFPFIVEWCRNNKNSRSAPELATEYNRCQRDDFMQKLCNSDLIDICEKDFALSQYKYLDINGNNSLYSNGGLNKYLSCQNVTKCNENYKACLQKHEKKTEASSKVKKVISGSLDTSSSDAKRTETLDVQKTTVFTNSSEDKTSDVNSIKKKQTGADGLEKSSISIEKQYIESPNVIISDSSNDSQSRNIDNMVKIESSLMHDLWMLKNSSDLINSFRPTASLKNLKSEKIIPILKNDYTNSPGQQQRSFSLPAKPRQRSKSSECECPHKHGDRPVLQRRKSVHFADSRGFDLEIEHTFRLSDDCIAPPRLMEEIRKNKASAKENNIQVNQCPFQLHNGIHSSLSYNIRNTFAQPCEDEQFKQRIQRNKVCLEKLTMAPNSQSGSGTIIVENMEYNKNVFVRLTFNKWRSYLDVAATYVPGCDLNGNFDRFGFTFYIPRNFAGKENIEIAVCYRLPLTGREYWDNNNNANYILRCVGYHELDNHNHFALLS